MASSSRRTQRPPIHVPMDRNLALELVRVTVGAAIAAARFVGQKQKEKADAAAVRVMRHHLGFVDMDGVVVIGEGEKDEAPMLYIGEAVGNGQLPQVDIAVDPIDGTTLVANGLPGGIATIALAERGSLFHTHCYYMDKLIVGPRAAAVIDITDTVTANLRRIARAERRRVNELTVVVMDRPRHDALLGEIRAAGARVRMITDGDVEAGLMAAMEHRSGIDALMGTGGATEGVLAACAIKCVGGGMQARLRPRHHQERALIRAEGTDPDRVLGLDDLCGGDNVFFAATGITDGQLLRGVRFQGDNRATTHSVAMRSYSGTIRYMVTEHGSGHDQPRRANLRGGAAPSQPRHRTARQPADGTEQAAPTLSAISAPAGDAPPDAVRN